MLLTGTPLQNTVEELFSLLHFLEPAQFPSEIEFLREFGDLKTEEQVEKSSDLLFILAGNISSFKSISSSHHSVTVCDYQVQKLQSILKPMMLRRLKEDVEKNLAPKQETIIEVCLSNRTVSR